MLPPEQDVEDRAPIWDSFQWIYQDTDPKIYYKEMIEACVPSKYSILDLEQILLNEVLPALKFNMFDLAGDWQGYELQWLVNRILQKHRFGKRKPLLLRRYTQYHWRSVKKAIETERGERI